MNCIYRGPRLQAQPCGPCAAKSQGVISKVIVYACRKKGNCVISGDVGVQQCVTCNVPRIGIESAELTTDKPQPIHGETLTMRVSDQGGNW